MSADAGTTRPGSANERAAFIRQALIERLLAEQSAAELANLPLGALAVGLTHGSVPLRAQLLWFAALVAATLVRMLVRRGVAERAPDNVPNSLRVAITAVAAVWGVGIFAIAPHVPQVEVALLLLIICGLTAGATSTLLADAQTYLAYNIALLGFTALGALRLSDHGDFRVAFVIILFYGGVMASFYLRLRRVLMRSLENEYEIGFSRATVERERAFLDKLIASAPIGIAVVDGRHRLTRANPYFERLFGYRIDDVRETPLDQLILSPEQRLVSIQFQQRLAEGGTLEVEGRRLRADGTEVDVAISATQLAGEGGGTLVMYDDITERKQAERELRESEARLFQTLANLPVGIMVIDAKEGLPIFVNEAATNLLGKGIAPHAGVDELAETYRAYIAGTNQYYPVERMPIVRALAGEEVTVDDMEIHRPNDHVNIEVFGSPIRDADGNVMFGVAAFMDITERRRIAEALKSARVAAEEATAAKSAFLANMSHEIRTPLNGILGMAELLLDAGLSDDQRKSVHLIMQSGETLLRVINDILDFSKIEAGQLEIESTETDLETAVESTVRLLMPRATAHGIEIISEVRDSVPRSVLSDPTRLRQVLTNLVGNAVKFTKQGEVNVLVERVDDGTIADTARIRFSVRDTGVGIPAAKLDTIFEAFRQADASTTRRFGGTGLGLSISRRLVELMGGRLSVESEEGAGSTFSFEITAPIVEPRDVSAAAPRLKGLRVLIVDDNATNRRILCEMLGGAGCTVAEAPDAIAGLNALRDARRAGEPYAVVVTDLLMPGMDGFDFVRAIRNDPSLAPTRVVLATSVSRRGDAALARELSIAAYLLKPVSRQELLDAMKTAVSATPARSAPVTTGFVSTPPLTSPCRVLLAEDNAVNQEVATAILRRRGHFVDVVEDGRAAVEAVKRAAYDVVLMDLQMPELDGLEATAEIRRDPANGRVRIVALTANAMAGERERCLAGGMDDYLAKPFKANDLLAAVENRDHDAARTGGMTAHAVDIHGLRRDLELGGIADAFGDIIRVFRADSPSRMSALRAAVAASDATAISRAAHAFKSAAATIRATRLAELLGELETLGRARQLQGTSERLSGIEIAYDAVCKELDRTGVGS